MGVANGSTIGPAPGSGITARHIVLVARGADGPPNNPAHAISIGGSGTIAINAFAPNGTLSIGSQTTAVGAFLGKRVSVGSNTVMTLDSSFLIPES